MASGFAMTLDLVKVYNQVEAMAGELRSGQADYRLKLASAMDGLEKAAAEQEKLSRRIESARTTFLVAGLKEDLAQHIPAGSCPADFIVIASDGSHIDVDRHQSARLFLLNTGLVQLQYGDNSGAVLTSIPELYYGDERMALRSADGRQDLIQGPLLGVKRGVEECRHLAEHSEAADPSLPLVSLIDGSLIMWGLVGGRYDDFVIEQLLINGFLKQLDRFAAMRADRMISIASYISFPRGTDVINLLRVKACPYDQVDCDKNCKGMFEDRPCDTVGGLLDRAIYNEMLAQGERSPVFSTSSTIVEKYGAHRVCFFYLKTDEEVARVEVPMWIADNPELLALTHAVIYDQCSKGFGYPVALSEAHEQAVITGADREQFWNLVDRSLSEDSLALQGSLKQRSKKVKWI